MAADAAELTVLIRIGVAFGTVFPLTFMVAAVDREVLLVVVESSWRPGFFGVAFFATGRKLRYLVRRIGGLVVGFRMTGKAAVRTFHIIALMTIETIAGYALMGTPQHIITVVHGKSGRLPVGVRAVAGSAVLAQPQCSVTGIGSLVELLLMAAAASRGSAVVA